MEALKKGLELKRPFALDLFSSIMRTFTVGIQLKIRVFGGRGFSSGFGAGKISELCT